MAGLVTSYSQAAYTGVLKGRRALEAEILIRMFVSLHLLVRVFLHVPQCNYVQIVDVVCGNLRVSKRRAYIMGERTCI